MQYRFPVQSRVELSAAPKAMVTQLNELIAARPSLHGYVVLGPSTPDDWFLFLHAGGVFGAGAATDQGFEERPIEAFFAAAVSATKAELFVTDLPLLQCMAGLFFKKPTDRIAAQHLEGASFVDRVRRLGESATSVAIRLNQAVSFVFCWSGEPAILYPAASEVFPVDGTVGERIDKYVVQSNAATVGFVADLYDDVRLRATGARQPLDSYLKDPAKKDPTDPQIRAAWNQIEAEPTPAALKRDAEIPDLPPPEVELQVPAEPEVVPAAASAATPAPDPEPEYEAIEPPPAPEEGVHHLVASLGDRLVSWIPITEDEVTIGRSPDNDLVLDNLSVSRKHATARRTEKGLLIDASSSENKLLLVGRQVESAELIPGEEIGIGKYTVRFTGVGVPTRAVVARPFGLDDPDPIEETMALDRRVVPFIEYDGQQHKFGGNVFTIGTGTQASIRIGGLFIAAVHIRIERKRDGYIVQHVAGRRKVTHNGKPATEAVLVDGDELAIGAHQFRFVVPEPEKPKTTQLGRS